MNRLLMTLLTMSVWLALGASGFDSQVPAQTNQSSSSPGAQPCLENGGPGRPVLKRRQPASDTTKQKETANNQKTEAGENCASSSADVNHAGQQPADCRPGDKCAPQRLAIDVASKSEPIVVNVKFEGSHFLSEADVLKMAREHRALPRDHMPDAGAIDKGVAILKQLFQDVGLNDARVDVVSDERLNSITLLVNEGVPFTIAEVRFEGNHVFASQELAGRIGKCLADNEESSYNGYDRETLAFCEHQLANFVRSQGYLQAKLGEPKKTVIGNGVVLTIPVQEGILYRLGEVRIEASLSSARSADLPRTKQLISKLALHRGDIADGEKLSKWLYEDLRALYGEMGFIQCIAELNPTFKDNPQNPREGIVDIEVTIDEGKRFRLGPLRFEGSDLPDAELQELFLIREGEIFNQRLFAESVNKLNNTGLFYFIDKDQDSDFKTDEETGTVSVVIKLQRKKD